jgi:hypothetical protein
MQSMGLLGLLLACGLAAGLLALWACCWPAGLVGLAGLVALLFFFFFSVLVCT